MSTKKTIKTIKTILSLITLCFFCTISLADTLSATDAAKTTTPILSQTPQNKAFEFVQQAGSIAGIAKACGQDTSIFTSRISEAVKKLTSNPTDQAASMMLFQQIANTAQANEQKSQLIPCAQVANDFKRLPIMQADYKEKVISQLK